MFTIREASLADREAILNLRPDVYDGQDYLPVYIDYFFNSKERVCIMCEANGQLVGFMVMFFIDDGESCLLQCARVKEDFEGRGVYSFMSKSCGEIARERGAKQTVAGNNSTLKMYKNKFEKGKGIVTNLTMIFSLLGAKDSDKLLTLPAMALQKINGTDVGTFFKIELISNYLFPNKRIVVDWVPYKTIEANIHLLDGAYTVYYSDVRVQGQTVTGLLSSWTRYDVPFPGQMHLVEFYGTDASSLQKHLHHYLRENVDSFKNKTSVSIFHIQAGSFLVPECIRLLKETEVLPYRWSDDLTEDGACFMTFFETSLLQ